MKEIPKETKQTFRSGVSMFMSVGPVELTEYGMQTKQKKKKKNKHQVRESKSERGKGADTHTLYELRLNWYLIS